MEIISSSQLQKYDEILEEISREFEKCEQLKKQIEKADDRIVALKLSVSQCKQKISHVNIKIFNNVSEIYNLYDDVVSYCDLETLGKQESCKFYLVEVFLTECLVNKLDLQWRLQINVRCNTFCSCRVVPLSNKPSVMEVIPIDSDIRECTVETCLFLHDGNNWDIIDLQSVDVDISYHFESTRDKNKSKSLSEMLAEVTKLYHQSSSLACMQPSIQSQKSVKCNFEKSAFISSIVRNAYHRLDLEAFSEFSNDSKNIFDLQFLVDNNNVLILYNKNSNVLKIKCCTSEMLLLEKFFLKHFFTCDYHKLKRKLKGITRQKDAVEQMDLKEMFLLYQEIRKLWL